MSNQENKPYVNSEGLQQVMLGEAKTGEPTILERIRELGSLQDDNLHALQAHLTNLYERLSGPTPSVSAASPEEEPLGLLGYIRSQSEHNLDRIESCQQLVQSISRLL